MPLPVLLWDQDTEPAVATERYARLATADGGVVAYHDDAGSRAVRLDEPDGFTRNTAVRDVSQSAPGRRGTTTRSRFPGSATIALKGSVVAESRAAAIALYRQVEAAALDSIDTPRLITWYELGDVELQSMGRLVSMEDPKWESGAAVLRFQHQFRCDDPWAYSQALHVARSQHVAPTHGQTMPAHMPVVLGDPANFARVAVSNAGDRPTPAVIRIFGFAQDPHVLLEGTDLTIALTGTIGAGSFMEIDVSARSIKLNGTTSRLGMRDPSLTTWWEIPPGDHVIDLLTSGQDTNTALEIEWRDARS